MYNSFESNIRSGKVVLVKRGQKYCFNKTFSRIKSCFILLLKYFQNKQQTKYNNVKYRLIVQ